MEPPPVAKTVFRLTPRGEALWPVMAELGRWGGALLAKRARTDVFRTHWLAIFARLHLKDQRPDLSPVTIEVRSGDEALTIEARDGAVRTRPGSASRPDAVLAGPPDLIVALLASRLDLRAARRAGLQFEGNPEALRRLQPLGPLTRAEGR